MRPIYASPALRAIIAPMTYESARILFSAFCTMVFAGVIRWVISLLFPAKHGSESGGLTAGGTSSDVGQRALTYLPSEPDGNAAKR